MTTEREEKPEAAEPAPSAAPDDVEALKALLEDERGKAQSYMQN